MIPPPDAHVNGYVVCKARRQDVLVADDSKPYRDEDRGCYQQQMLQIHIIHMLP